MGLLRRTTISVLTAAGLVVATAGPAAALTLKQNSTDTINTSLSCSDTSSSSYLRLFDLGGDYALEDAFTVTSVSFGISAADSGSDASQSVNVRLYTIPSGDPFLMANLTEIQDVPTAITDAESGTVKTVATNAVVADPATADLVVAVSTPESTGSGHVFLMGANSDPQTAPSYIVAAHCGVTEPTSFGSTWSWVLYADGEEDAGPDVDVDGVPDDSDNCVNTPNADQLNTDNDALGDACDPDDDADGVTDDVDNCTLDANTDQANLDGDEFGDVCDGDDDGDTVDDAVDNCPADANTDQANLDGDELGDVCDGDDDGDAVDDDVDNCPVDANGGQANLDGDEAGDVCDSDDDGDTVDDDVDNCAVDPNTDQANLDGDELGDVCDGDDDGDTVDDAVDNCPTDANTDQANHDEDSLGDACDDDDDGDGVLDEADACDRLSGDPARTKAQGCPAVPRSLSAHFHAGDGDLDGTLEAAAPECVAEVPVVVSWRKNDGTMRRRTTTTDPSGDFAVHTGPVKRDGANDWFFWVRAPAVLVEDVGFCEFTTLRDADTRIHR